MFPYGSWRLRRSQRMIPNGNEIMADKSISPDVATGAIRNLEELVRRGDLTGSPTAKAELERLVAQLPGEVLRRALENLGGTYGLTRAVAESAALPERVDLILRGEGRFGQVALPARIAAPDRSSETAADSSGRTDPVADSGHELLAPQDVGRLVRQARERMSLTQQAFADLAGVGRRFLSELENGKETLELGKVMRVTRAAGILLFARER